MTDQNLLELLKTIQLKRAETQTLELKSAEHGCPTHLYDTLSAFSNQDDGGTIVFGVDEKQGFAEVGVYNAQDLQQRVTAQCNQMQPVVRPVFTIAEKDGKQFVAAEIPGIEVADRPCYYAGKGRLKGSYIRVGDADEPMTEYEVYSYEAFRRKYQDDIRLVERASIDALDQSLLGTYIAALKSGKPNLSRLSDNQILDLMSITRNGMPTLAAVLLFSPYPQAYFPQLCITAVSVAGEEIGELGPNNERFLDSKRLDGNLMDMLDEAIGFVKKNLRFSIVFDEKTGMRMDQPEYPMLAVREAILNALIHRDYSIHTEGMPIQLLLFNNRFEIRSPGGLYGRIRIDQLGKAQPDTRNPVIVAAMETLHKTENRYSGIPTMRRELKESGLPAPEFKNDKGSFVTCFYKKMEVIRQNPEIELTNESEFYDYDTVSENLLAFCRTPRTRQEIAKFLKISSIPYAMKRYITPLVENGSIKLLLPDVPKSKNQKYITV